MMTAWWRRVRDAARLPAVWLGFVATTVIALSAATSFKLAPNFASFRPLRTLRSMIPPHAGDLLMLPGILALTLAFVWLRPELRRRALPLRSIFLLWSAPLLFAPPVLSDDMYLYLDQGWQLQHGYAPYSVGLTAGGGPFANAVYTFWRATPAIYPPLAVEFQRLAVVLGREHVVSSVWAMRAIVVASCLVLSWAVPVLARRVRLDPDRALFLALLNPLTVIHFVGGGHNDALMVAFSALAFVVALRRGPWWPLAAVLAGCAALSKQPGMWAAVVVAMLAFPTARWMKRLLVTAASVAIAAATFVAVSLGTGLGFGWIKGTDSPSRIPTVAPANVASQLLLQMTGHNVWPLLKVACYLPALLVFAWLIWRRWRFPFTSAAGGWIAYALCAPALHPWYLLGGLPWVGLLRLRPATSALIKVACVYLLVGSWATEVVHLDPMPAAFVALFFALSLVWGWEAIQRQVRAARDAREQRRSRASRGHRGNAVE